MVAEMVAMNTVEVLENVSLGGLSEQVPQTHSGSWQVGHQRTQVLILCQRRHRDRFEQHAAGLALEHPTWSLFYRPRAEADEISAAGLDPLEASFLFLDVALPDLGRWVGPLIADDWAKEEVTIMPAMAADDDFEAMLWTAFRDPWLAQVSDLPLATAPHSIVAKAWLTVPAGAIVQPTPPVHGVEGAGAPAGGTPTFPTPGIPPTAPMPQPPPPAAVPAPEPAPVAAPPAPAPAPAAAPEPFEMPTEPVAIPTFGEGTAAAAPAVDVPAPDPVSDEPTPIHDELLETIRLLRAGGVAPDDMMDDPTFQGVSERATAAGLDVWSIFIQEAGT